ncbi:MAG: hypothetical protein ACOYJQ_17955 [Pseudochelatococcus sp.]
MRCGFDVLASQPQSSGSFPPFLRIPDPVFYVERSDTGEVWRVLCSKRDIPARLQDLAIALDSGLGDGSHASRIVSAGNMMVLPLLAWATVVMVSSAPQAEAAPRIAAVDTETRPDAPGAYDDHVLAEVDRLMAERKLYRDRDLTLDRLSRRLGIPARQVSGAINRKLGRNVSQAINEWRVRETMELLVQCGSRSMHLPGMVIRLRARRRRWRMNGRLPAATEPHSSASAASVEVPRSAWITPAHRR